LRHFKGKVVIRSEDTMTTAMLTAAFTLLLSFSAAIAPAARAQSEGWMLGPGSKTSKDSKVVPTNCVTTPDGAISCDTKVETPTRTTPARPYYNPFND
jgi:uncharacterized membrane protein|tara:strand:- start:90 stop:383 length:294 start_codon:yes stop_codon:yes gene_type:complete